MGKKNRNHQEWGWDRIIAILTLLSSLLTPIVLLILSYNLNEYLERRKDVDILIERSLRIEESYRDIKNHYEGLERGISVITPTFWGKLSTLDYNMINFHFKIMTLYTPDKKRYNKAREAAQLFDKLYWGKGSIGGDYSFRELLIKYERLARKDRDRFSDLISEIKPILQYVDDLMHLTILTSLFAVHRQSEEIEKRFIIGEDNIADLEKRVNPSEPQKAQQLIKSAILKIDAPKKK